MILCFDHPPLDTTSARYATGVMPTVHFIPRSPLCHDPLAATADNNADVNVAVVVPLSSLPNTKEIGEVGYKFRKQFGTMGWFTGTVVEIIPNAELGYDRRCVYTEDGDVEDMRCGERNIRTLLIRHQSMWVRLQRDIKNGRRLKFTFMASRICLPCEVLLSRPNLACGNNWRLELYPGGDAFSRTGWVAIYLTNRSNKNVTVQFGFSIKDSTGELFIGPLHHFWSCGRPMPRSRIY